LKFQYGAIEISMELAMGISMAITNHRFLKGKPSVFDIFNAIEISMAAVEISIAGN
jgi:hypothetical protein